MARWLVFALSISAVFAATPVSGPQEREPAIVVVELFTSEGCATCLPAERLALSLDAGSGVRAKGRGLAPSRGIPVEVIILGEHVDYFDTLAWADRYSSPLFSARQQDYGIALHRAVMYTPQMIVNGQYEVNDLDLKNVSAAIRAATVLPRAPAKIGLAKDGNVVLRVGKLPPGSHTADILLAITESGLNVKIGGGENEGKTLPHAPVVHTLTRIGEVDPAHPGEYEVEAKLNLRPDWTRSKLKAVLLVQDRTTRRILGAASVKLQSTDPR